MVEVKKITPEELAEAIGETPPPEKVVPPSLGRAMAALKLNSKSLKTLFVTL